MCQPTWRLDGSEAGVDLVLIHTSVLFLYLSGCSEAQGITLMFNLNSNTNDLNSTQLETNEARFEKQRPCFTTAVVSLNIPESDLFADFVKRLENDTCFHG